MYEVFEVVSAWASNGGPACGNLDGCGKEMCAPMACTDINSYTLQPVKAYAMRYCVMLSLKVLTCKFCVFLETSLAHSTVPFQTNESIGAPRACMTM